MTFSTRTFLRAAAAIGATAAAVTLATPATAASSGRASDGAQHYNQTLCSTSGTETECYIQDFVRIEVTTPSGKTNVIENGTLDYTATDPANDTARASTRNTHYHRLASGDETKVISNHNTFSLSLTPGQTCTDTYDSHFANGREQYQRFTYSCTP